MADQDQHFSKQDQQIETVKQKQFELSHLGEGNSQEITALRKNLTDDMDRLDRNLNSTEEKHRKLSSHVLTHGHGNKQRIDKLAQQFKTVLEEQTMLISQNDVLDQRINASLTNVTDLSFQMNNTNSVRPSRTSYALVAKIILEGLLAVAEMADRLNNLIDRVDRQKKKVDVLWINYLNSKNLILPIVANYNISRPHADIVKTPHPRNLTFETAIRNAIDEIDLNVAEFKRLAFDHIRILPNDIKLHPIDSNLKKVNGVLVFPKK